MTDVTQLSYEDVEIASTYFSMISILSRITMMSKDELAKLKKMWEKARPREEDTKEEKAMFVLFEGVLDVALSSDLNGDIHNEPGFRTLEAYLRSIEGNH